MHFPEVIQGGMGIGVSGWQLARAVAKENQLGVVSGTGIATVLCRRLQDGDMDGAMRRALDNFPDQGIARDIVGTWYIHGGKPRGQPYRLLPMYSLQSSRHLMEVTIAAAFAEVFLAKEGHSGQVGINLLEKAQFPNMATVYGAMLAGVDFILMGAGIPRDVPASLDALTRHCAARFTPHIRNAPPSAVQDIVFEPREFIRGVSGTLERPVFLAVISSSTLATSLARKSRGEVNGFVVESHIAGGHNAPPRGARAAGSASPVEYGPRDDADLNAIGELGLPFWLAGGQGKRAALSAAKSTGAAGIQVGTLFAFCAESGLSEDIKAAVRKSARHLRVLTDSRASPSGLPFKVLGLPGSLADDAVYAARSRRCDVGLLREPYFTDTGEIRYRCAAEPTELYAAKGGTVDDTLDRKCLCNGLLAGIGLGQVLPDGSTEPPLVTSGITLDAVADLAGPDGRGYSALQALEYVTG